MKYFAYAVMLVVAVVAVFIYSGWKETIYWNQKYTLAVETPSGVVENSVIVQMRTMHDGNGSSRTGIYGEAPFVKLPNGRYLFALSLYNPFDVPRAYADHWGLEWQAQKRRDFFKRIAGSNEEIDLAYHLPILITFDDIENLATVRQVNPAFLAGALGRGYKLKRYSVSVTDEPATYGSIRQIAEWMIFRNEAFNPNYSGINKKGEQIKTFNRSILARTVNCTLDAFTMHNLTMGLRSKGLFCNY